MSHLEKMRFDVNVGAAAFHTNGAKQTQKQRWTQIRRSWVCLPGWGGLCVTKQVWPLEEVQDWVIWAEREDQWFGGAPTNQRQASPTYHWEWLACPWNAVIFLKIGLMWNQLSAILLFLLPAPRKRTGPVWCQFKWPCLLFLQYCLSQSIRHLGSEPWSSASVSRDIMAASQHAWTEICI